MKNLVYRETVVRANGRPSRNPGGKLRQWLNSDPAWLIWRLLMVYAALAICRVVFYIYNYDLIGAVSWSEMGGIIRGSLRFDTVSVLYANAFFIILSLFPLRIRAKRWWRGIMFGYYVAANGISVALNLSDCVYFHYTQKRLTGDEAFFAENDNSLHLFFQFMLDNWYLVIIGALLIWGLIFAYRRKAVPQTPIQNPWAYYGISLLILAAAGILTVGGIRGGLDHSIRPITLSNATQYTDSPSKANLVLSNPFCVVRTLGNERLTYRKYYSPEELNQRFTPYKYPAPADAPLEGRNVVIFILESFSAEHSAYLNPHLYEDREEKGFTPFLDSLMSEGFTFTRAYSNGRKSIEALPSIMGSIPSFKTPFVLMPQSLGRSRQLPAILAGKGYTTAFFCGSNHGSMGFDAYARSAGVQQLYAQQDYEKKRDNNDFDGYWGIWDEPFIDYMGEELSAMSQPFMSTIFTLSSHHPFNVPAKYAEEIPKGWTKIHQGVRYTDNSIKKFFEKYSGEDWFAGTVFVFAADHVSSETFAPETRLMPEANHIIQFIYTPDGAMKGEYGHTVQQTDIMPTLLGMMGNREPFFSFGRDVRNEPDMKAVMFGYATREMSYYIADDDYLIFGDDMNPLAIYRMDDKLQQNPLVAPYPERVTELYDYLKALTQQYYVHVEAMSYVVPE